jgi:hypothetical protein
LRAITVVFVFSRASVFSVRTSSFVHGRALIFFAILVLRINVASESGAIIEQNRALSVTTASTALSSDRNAAVNDALLFVLLAAAVAAVVYGTIGWLRKNRDDHIHHPDEHHR